MFGGILVAILEYFMIHVFGLANPSVASEMRDVIDTVAPLRSTGYLDTEACEQKKGLPIHHAANAS